jgi:hypothetical protein
VNLLLRVLALATVLLGSGCASLSHAERDRAEAIAVQARSTEVDCQRADRCAQDSPLRALAGRAFTESTRNSRATTPPCSTRARAPWSRA